MVISYIWLGYSCTWLGSAQATTLNKEDEDGDGGRSWGNCMGGGGVGGGIELV